MGGDHETVKHPLALMLPFEILLLITYGYMLLRF